MASFPHFSAKTITDLKRGLGGLGASVSPWWGQPQPHAGSTCTGCVTTTVTRAGKGSHVEQLIWKSETLTFPTWQLVRDGLVSAGAGSERHHDESHAKLSLSSARHSQPRPALPSVLLSHKGDSPDLKAKELSAILSAVLATGTRALPTVST